MPFKGVGVSDRTKMGWQGVPCSWARVAEATLAELSSCSAFKVVCCIRRSQVSKTTGVDWLYTVNQLGLLRVLQVTAGDLKFCKLESVCDLHTQNCAEFCNHQRERKTLFATQMNRRNIQQ